MSDPQPTSRIVCPSCAALLAEDGANATTGTAPTGSRGRSAPYGTCPNCGVVIDRAAAGWTLNVTGTSAAEVSEVSKLLNKELSQEWEQNELRQSPWVSGLFYLVAAVVILIVLLVIGKSLALWALPIVVIGGVVLISVVGALQLRQDGRLSERSFVELMADVLKQLPLIARRGSSAERDNNESGPS